MEKPSRITFKPTYKWQDIENYIEKKYNIKLRGYKKENDKEFRDYWYWICNRCEIHKGCFFYLPELENDEWWIVEITELIIKNFPELKKEQIWVDW